MDQAASFDAVARARMLGPAIAASADEIEVNQRFPEPLLSRLLEARLFRLLLPRSCGGEQVDPSTYLRALIEVSRCDGSVGWNMFVANSACLIAPFLPLESAHAVFGDPRSVCAWGAVNGTAARAVEGGYWIEGEWDFASGCRQANWMGAHGPVLESDGSYRLNEFGRPLIRTWLFPAAEAELLDNWNPVGLKGTASESYRVPGVFVPEEFSSTREYPEQRREPGPLYAFPQQGLYAVGVAGVALGLARAMLDAFRDLAVEKTPRGRPRLALDALVQAGFARTEAQWGSARAYMLQTLEDIYARADEMEPIRVDDRAGVRLCCSHAIHTALSAADWVHKEAGVSAIFPGSPFERHWRDIHTVSQQIQSRSAHFEAVGQILLGQPPEVFF